MTKDKKPRLKVKKVTIPVTYNLVYWPDGCNEVPTFDQLMDTLELVLTVMDMMEAGEDIGEELHQEIVSWLLFNDIEKFRKAVEDAEKHQDMVNDCVVDNMMFPFPLSKFKGGH